MKSLLLSSLEGSPGNALCQWSQRLKDPTGKVCHQWRRSLVSRSKNQKSQSGKVSPTWQLKKLQEMSLKITLLSWVQEIQARGECPPKWKIRLPRRKISQVTIPVQKFWRWCSKNQSFLSCKINWTLPASPIRYMKLKKNLAVGKKEKSLPAKEANYYYVSQ